MGCKQTMPPLRYIIAVWMQLYKIKSFWHLWTIYSFIWCYLLSLQDTIMSPMASQITAVSIVCQAVCSGADQRKHQSYASLTFVMGFHLWPVNSPHKGPETRKMYPSYDAIMIAKIDMNTYCLRSVAHSSGLGTISVLISFILHQWYKSVKGCIYIYMYILFYYLFLKITEKYSNNWMRLVLGI